MNPEDRIRHERLDRRIDQAQRGRPFSIPLKGAESDAFKGYEEIRELRKIDIPRDFHDALRQQVLARAATPALSTDTRPLWKDRPLTRMWPRRRVVTSLLAAVASVVAIGTFLIVRGTADSVPGEMLYPIKAWSQNVSVAQASDPVTKARTSLDNFHDAIQSLATEVTAHHSDSDIADALAIIDTRGEEASGSIAKVPLGSQHDRLQQQYGTDIAYEIQILHQYAPASDWMTKLRFTRRLAALGVTTPMLNYVAINPIYGQQFEIEITGIDIQEGAQLVINGIVVDQHVDFHNALFHTMLAALPELPFTVGVLNPDATAVDTTITQLHVDNSEPPGQSDNGMHGTPIPGNNPSEATPDPGGDEPPGTVSPTDGNNHHDGGTPPPCWPPPPGAPPPGGPPPGGPPPGGPSAGGPPLCGTPPPGGFPPH